MDEEMMTVDEAVASLGVARSTFFRWIAAREVPTFQRIGDKRSYVRRADVEALRVWQPRRQGKDAA
jgi:excisionase family DNA binding protein